MRQAALAHDRTLATALLWVEVTHGPASFGDLSAFIAAHPDWPSQTLLRERAEEQTTTLSDAAAAAWFAEHPPVTQTGKLRQVDLLLDKGRTAEAAALLREVWIDGNLDKFAQHSLFQAYHALLRPVDHEARLDRLLWDGDDADARRMLTMVDPAHRALAEARLALFEMDPGSERLVARVPAELQHDPGLTYDRVRWRRRKERYDEAVALLDTVPREKTHLENWAVEREVLARYALAENKPAAAYRIASQHGLESGAHFAELEFLSGWTALRFLHQPETAYNHFVRLYDTVKLPISVARGAYWAARAAEAMGYRQLAEAWYSTARAAQ